MVKNIELRDVEVKRNGVGYLLEVGTRTTRITPTEVERLMESILKVHPGVTDGVKAAWDNRHNPVIEVSEFMGLVGKEIIPVAYQATVIMGNVELTHMRTKKHEHPEDAVLEMQWAWGKVLHVLPEFNRLNASSKQAKNDLITLKAEAFCREKGITMEELWAQVTGK